MKTHKILNENMYSLKAYYMHTLKDLCKSLGGTFKEGLLGLSAICTVDLDKVTDNLDKILHTVSYTVDGKNIREMIFKNKEKELVFEKIDGYPMHIIYNIQIGDIDIHSISEKEEIEKKIKEVMKAVEREKASFITTGIPVYQDTTMRKILGLSIGASLEIRNRQELKESKRKLNRIINLLNRYERELF